MKKIEQKLNQIFSNTDKSINEIAKRGYVYALAEPRDLLFVGLNPSYTNKATSENYSYKISDAVKNYPKHYKAFNDLATGGNYKNNWTYIDLFYFRETNQKTLNYLIKKDINFILEQLKVTNEIIKKINPKIIFVANSNANYFFGVNKKK